MKGRNFSKSMQRTKYVLTDFVMVSIAFFLFNIFRYHELGIHTYGFPTLWDYLSSTKLITEQILVPLGLSGIYWLSGYYNEPFIKSRLSELSTTVLSVTVSTMILYLILLINDTTGLKIKDYEVILTLFGSLLLFTYSGRWALTQRTIRHLRKRHWIYSTLIIGNSKKSRDIYNKLKKSGSIWTYDVVGFIKLEREHQIADGLPSWEWNEVEHICADNAVDQIILAPEVIRDSEIMNILSRLFPLNIPVKIAPDTLSYITANIHMNDILGTPFIDLTSPRISEFQKNVKRTFDVFASLAAMTILSPLLGLTALMVRFSSSGPIVYKQERIGKGHKPFMIYKFRSMHNDAEKNGPQLSSETDNRITPWGRVMRKYRLDELPQFWNVLKGDMSLVGPRPEREFFIEQIMVKAPYYGLIFQVKPGITSWGMVKYGYAKNVNEMVSRSRYDLIYLNNMSISTDIKIMIYTIKTVLKGAGV